MDEHEKKMRMAQIKGHFDNVLMLEEVALGNDDPMAVTQLGMMADAEQFAMLDAMDDFVLHSGCQPEELN